MTCLRGMSFMTLMFLISLTLFVVFMFVCVSGPRCFYPESLRSSGIMLAFLVSGGNMSDHHEHLTAVVCRNISYWSIVWIIFAPSAVKMVSVTQEGHFIVSLCNVETCRINLIYFNTQHQLMKTWTVSHLWRVQGEQGGSFRKHSFRIFSSRISHFDKCVRRRPELAVCKRNRDGDSMQCWFHLGCSAIIQERRRGGLVERHHFTPPIPLRHHWNIILCLLTFKSCSAAVISIGPAAISVKCPLATLLLHMEDFLSPSMVSLLYFAPSLHLAFYPTCPLKPDCDDGGNLLH